MMLIRYRWSLLLSVGTGVAIAGWGLGEALAGDLIGSSRFGGGLGSTFRLVLFAVATVAGFWRLRRARRSQVVSSLGPPPPGSDIATLPQTARVVAAASRDLSLGVVIGLYLPFVGAAAGGAALGAALSLAWVARKLVRIERRDGVRVLYGPPPRWLYSGREPIEGYFRVAATPSGLDPPE